MQHGLTKYENKIEAQLFEYDGSDWFVTIWFNSAYDYVIMFNGQFLHKTRFDYSVIKNLILNFLNNK